MKAKASPSLATIQNKIISCRKCPRLVSYIEEIREQFPDFWCRPVPGFGDPQATIVLLGLAPGKKGSNRTGRMFTGDASGDFLFPALHTLGLASQPTATEMDDGMKLHSTYITAAVNCAPPQNKPSMEEIKTCSPFVDDELLALPNVKVIVALGKIAHDAWLRLRGETLSRYPFRHGALYEWDGLPALVDSYHPSRQNTNTGKLTMPMFLEPLRMAKRLAGLDT